MSYNLPDLGGSTAPPDPPSGTQFFYSQYDSRYVGRDWLLLSRDRFFLCTTLIGQWPWVVDNAHSCDCRNKKHCRELSAPNNAAFQSPRANGAHDFEVGKIPVQPYVAFHSRTEPRWLIVLSCSFLLCLLLALINSVNRVFVLQRTHALHTCSCTSLTQQRINLKPTHMAYQHKTKIILCRVA